MCQDIHQVSHILKIIRIDNMERNVLCQLLHCLASLRGFTSSPPPLFFMNMSVQEVGGLVNKAADRAFVIVVTSIVVVGDGVGTGLVAVAVVFAPESFDRYSSKFSIIREVQSRVELSPQHFQNPFTARIHFLRALEISIGSEDDDLVSVMASNST